MRNMKFKSKLSYGVVCLLFVAAIAFATPINAFAAFTDNLSISVNNIEAATYTIDVIDTKTETKVDDTFTCPAEDDYINTFTLEAKGTASAGYGIVTIDGNNYYTEQIGNSEAITIKVQAPEGTAISFASSWGQPSADAETLYGNDDTIVIAEPPTSEPEVTNPFAGKKISIMGDSISTYTGWSDADPITDESCTNRYGEAYYGPVGGDFHNTDLVVEDTWWHQAATELGAEILRVNSGNSTGLLIAEYPSIPSWDLYLKEMLMYKSRPYYLGKDGEDPDIIALYVGSNEAARANKSQMGSIENVDFDQLIVENEDGTYTYATPTTVTESYCILLHKISVTYPDAEVYCFKVVPNSGGYLSTINSSTRLPNAYRINSVVDEVAEHYGAITVDLLDAFQLDPDGDGKAVQEDFDRFQTYFNGDPHPNAAGFDVITRCFVDTVLENSKYNK